jgi:hypothetical protein
VSLKVLVKGEAGKEEDEGGFETQIQDSKKD